MLRSLLSSRRPRRAAIMERVEPRQMLHGAVIPKLVEVPISAAAISADPALSGYKSYDLKVEVTLDADWVSSGLTVTLSQGNFYNAADGGNTAIPGLWSSKPNVQFDTFVTAPNFTDPLVLGAQSPGAGNTPVFSSTKVDVAWGDITNTGAGEFTVARLTMTAGAVGVIDGQVSNIETPETPTHFLSSLPLLPGGASIQGFAFFDHNANGRKSGGEGKFPDVQVYIDVNNNGVLDPTGEKSVRSRSNGNFTFSGLEAGTYRLRTTVPAGYRLSNPKDNQLLVTVIDGAAIMDRRFGLTQRLDIGGQVYEDKNKDKVRGPGEKGMSGWTVYVDANDNQTLDPGELTTLTTGKGWFAFTDLEAGIFTIRVADQDGWRRTTQGGFTISLPPGGARSNLFYGFKNIA